MAFYCYSPSETFVVLTADRFFGRDDGQFASLDFFVNKCRHDINKLNFNRDTKFSNLFSEERAALKNLSKRKDIIVKAADKGGAILGPVYKEVG